MTDRELAARAMKALDEVAKLTTDERLKILERAGHLPPEMLETRSSTPPNKEPPATQGE